MGACGCGRYGTALPLVSGGERENEGTNKQMVGLLPVSEWKVKNEGSTEIHIYNYLHIVYPCTKRSVSLYLHTVLP